MVYCIIHGCIVRCSGGLVMTLWGVPYAFQLNPWYQMNFLERFQLDGACFFPVVLECLNGFEDLAE